MAFHQQPIYYMDLVEFKWHVIDMCRLFFLLIIVGKHVFTNWWKLICWRDTIYSHLNGIKVYIHGIILRYQEPIDLDLCLLSWGYPRPRELLKRNIWKSGICSELFFSKSMIYRVIIRIHLKPSLIVPCCRGFYGGVKGMWHAGP